MCVHGDVPDAKLGNANLVSIMGPPQQSTTKMKVQ